MKGNGKIRDFLRRKVKCSSETKDILRLALTLLAICATVAALLGAVNAVTKDRIAAANARKTAQAVAAVLEDGETAEEIPCLAGEGSIVTQVYRNAHGYAVRVCPNGFGGTITMMVGVADGKVSGISIISNSETPGLGAVAAADNAKGAAFRAQFIGLVSGIVLGGTQENAVDALSCATITSAAVTQGVNAALEYVASVQDMGGTGYGS